MRKQAFSIVLIAALVGATVTPSLASAATPVAKASNQTTPIKTVTKPMSFSPVSAVMAKKAKKAKKKQKRKLVVQGSVTSQIKAHSDKVTINGNINHSDSKKGYVVKLQRWSYGWNTISTMRVKGKNFQFKNVSLWPRDTWFQLVTPSQGKYRSDDSRNMRVRVARCDTVSTPPQVTTAFTDAKAGNSYKPSPITRTFMDGICAAAKNSSIYITMYYSVFGNITSNSTGAGSVETAYIQRALQYVKDKRNVKIGMLAESRQYPKTKKEAKANLKKNGYGINWNQVVQTKKVFKQLTKGGHGTYFCQAGCRNKDNNSPGNLHSKYVVISKTNWAGNGPVVLNGSANFSAQQLRRTVNDLTQIYNNNLVYKSFENDWKVNRRCAVALRPGKNNKNCESNNGLYSVKGTRDQFYPQGKGKTIRWPNTYGVPIRYHNEHAMNSKIPAPTKDDVAKDAALRWGTDGRPKGFPGDAGKGIISFFSPVPDYFSYDYVTNSLRQLQCTPSRNSIKIMIGAFGTQRRTGYFFEQIKRLADSGCKIKIIMSGPTVKTKLKNNKSDSKTPSSAEPIKALKELTKSKFLNSGSVVARCTQAQHSKNFVFKTQRRLGNSDTSTQPYENFDGMLAGSPNMSAGALWGTESAEYMSPQDATDPSIKSNLFSAINKYSGHFDDVWNTGSTATCLWAKKK